MMRKIVKQSFEELKIEAEALNKEAKEVRRRLKISFDL